MDLRTGKLVNCFEETVTELRTISEQKAEKEKQLDKEKENEGLLQISLEDVKMTEIKLGEGAWGGNYERCNDVRNMKFLSRSEGWLLAWMSRGCQDIF